MKKDFICHYCGKTSQKEISAINRSKEINNFLFCDRVCSSQHRKIPAHSKRKIINSLEVSANNFISGSDRWLSHGVIMNLGLPSIILRPQL